MTPESLIKEPPILTDLAGVRAYKDVLGAPASNTSMERAWRFHGARFHLAKGDWDRAIAEYKHLIDLDPDEPAPYQDLADLYMKKGATKEVVVVLLTLGDLFQRLGMDQAARQTRLRAADLDTPPGVGGDLSASPNGAVSTAAAAAVSPAAPPEPAPPAARPAPVAPSPSSAAPQPPDVTAPSTPDAPRPSTPIIQPEPPGWTAVPNADAAPPPPLIDGLREAAVPSQQPQAARPAVSPDAAPPSADSPLAASATTPTVPASEPERGPQSPAVIPGSQLAATGGANVPATNPGSGISSTGGTSTPVRRGGGSGSAIDGNRKAGGIARPGTGPGSVSRKEALGGILVRMGLINDTQLGMAIDVQARTGEKLGRILLNMGLITPEDLAKVIGVQWGYPYVALSSVKIDPETVRLLPHHLALRHKVMAYGREGDKLLVALVDPLNLLALDDVRLITGFDVEPRITTEDELTNAISRFYIDSIMERPEFAEGTEDISGDEEVSLDRLRQMVDEAPVVKLVNVILEQAIREGASDIHVEPHRNGIHVRYRIDGVLHDVLSPPKNLRAALVSRLKIIANLDIAERRRPQDGRISVKMDGRDIDLRVSTLPTMFGEKVVMRILDQSSALISLSKLGMAEDVQKIWEDLAAKPYGMILVTGPTGSGKTTSLYATLSKINTLDKNIITIEDPVEYQLARINQVQTNPKAGLTFASGLRSILRQDPDVVMVGEIRDKETAEIAVQAALTGHLVLSTLHTNDAASAFTRLIDMGIEPFLISSSVIGVMAQRLARQICPKCKEPYKAPADAVRRLSEELAVDEDLTLFRGAGCPHCRQGGYKGRIGLYELLVVTDRVRELIVARQPGNIIKQAAQAEGMRSLREDGIKKVLSGHSTIEEIFRTVYVAD